MKLQISNHNYLTDTFSRIFPEYGTKALDVPAYDSDKHMFIVEQYVTKGGNRQITYVTVGGSLVVEVTVGFYHSWTLLNKVRMMIPDGTGLKTIGTYEWTGTKYFDFDDLKTKVQEMAVAYAADNAPMVGGRKSDELLNRVRGMISHLFSQNIDDFAEGCGETVLKAYCRQHKVCQDFI